MCINQLVKMLRFLIDLSKNAIPQLPLPQLFFINKAWE